MPLDANEELENIEPEMRTLAEVLVLRVAIYERLEKWELMAIVAKQLCTMKPDEEEWVQKWAYATRRHREIGRG